MANEVLFVGGRRESVFLQTGAFTEVTTAGLFDSAFADCALYCASRSTNSFLAKLYSQTANILTETTVTTGQTLYVHVNTIWSGSGTSLSPRITVRDSSGFPWFRIVAGSGSTNAEDFQWNSGTGASPVWTNFSTQYLTLATTLVTYDLVITLGSPHTVSLYINGSLVRTGTFTQANFTNVAAVEFAGSYSVYTCYSEIICTEGISTIGARVKTARATGAGANTGWTGSHTSVNEAVGNDATFQSAASAGLKSTHAMGDVTVASGFEIKSVFHWLRAKNDGSAPTNIKSVLRSGGVDYATGNLNYMTTGFVPVGARYDLDPTGTAWTQSSWNAIEAGYESAA